MKTILTAEAKYPIELQEFLSSASPQTKGAISKHLLNNINGIPKCISLDLFNSLIAIPFQTDLSWPERIYMVANNRYQYPDCPGCGSRIFMNKNTGKINNYCSGKCEQSNRVAPNKGTRAFYNTTTEEIRYFSHRESIPSGYSPGDPPSVRRKKSDSHKGLQSPFTGYSHTDESKKKIADTYENTMMETHGVRAYFMTDEFKKKSKETSNRKYGVSSTNSSPLIKEKKRMVWQERAGVDNYFQTDEGRKSSSSWWASLSNDEKEIHVEPWITSSHKPESRERASISRLTGLGYENIEILMDSIKFKEHCENTIKDSKTPFKDLYDFFNMKPRTFQRWLREVGISFSTGSMFEQEVREFYHSVTGKYCSNKRLKDSDNSIFELDIYDEEKNFSIECNGDYWHCELYKSPDYHSRKFFNAMRHGIWLFQIWESDWKNNRGACEFNIKRLLSNSVQISANLKITEDTIKEYLKYSNFKGNIDKVFKFTDDKIYGWFAIHDDNLVDITSNVNISNIFYTLRIFHRFKFIYLSNDFAEHTKELIPVKLFPERVFAEIELSVGLFDLWDSGSTEFTTK